MAIEAGTGNEFQNARASCIAGPCPFTRIEGNNFNAGNQDARLSARGQKGELICGGEMIVRADEAQFHEDTGEIQPNSHAIVMPLWHKPKI